MLDIADTRPLPTAIFCGSDAIAYGCMEVLADAGLQVPEDISIVGFDDTFMARMTRPPLTTVRQPFREMGRCAGAKLLLLISEPEIGATEGTDGVNADTPACVGSRSQVFPVKLVIRESVGPPRRTKGSGMQ